MSVDPRGLRFAAVLTTGVLAVVLVTSSVWLLAVQALVFAVGVVLGPSRSPYGIVFRRLVRPRLGPPVELEASGPPRFAQAVGLLFTVVALTGYTLNAGVLGVVAVAAALVAAFLNAAFGFCLGCEMYLLIRRTTHTFKGAPA